MIKFVVSKKRNTLNLQKITKRVEVRNVSHHMRLLHTQRGVPGIKGGDGEPGAPGQDGEGIPAGGIINQFITKTGPGKFDIGWASADVVDKNFRQDFSVTNSLSVVHGLNKYPTVTIINSAGDEVEVDVEYTSLNTLTISFSAPFGGTIVCN